MPCDPKSLMALARCFVGLSHKQLLQVKAWLLCQLAQKKSSPVVPVVVPVIVADPANSVNTTGVTTAIKWLNAPSPTTQVQIWRNNFGQAGTGIYTLVATVPSTQGEYLQTDYGYQQVAIAYKVAFVTNGVTSPFSNELLVDWYIGNGGFFYGVWDGVNPVINNSTLVMENGAFTLQYMTPTSVTFQNLLSVGGATTGYILLNGNTNLTTISFPQLSSVSAYINLSGCTALTTLNIPALSSVGRWMNVSGCTSLSHIAFNSGLSWVTGQPQPFDFSACALDAATVNAVLHMGVVGGLTTGDEIDLNGGTNAAPTGQGIIDKATLIAAGCTVNTN